MAREKKTDSFEKKLELLEGIVAALEDGGLSLDDSLKKFEHGIRLSRECEKSLSEAEKKIEILTKNADGKLEAAPFGDEEDPEEEEEEEEDDPEEEEEEEDPALRHPPAHDPAEDLAEDADEGPPPEDEDEGELLF